MIYKKYYVAGFFIVFFVISSCRQKLQSKKEPVRPSKSSIYSTPGDEMALNLFDPREAAISIKTSEVRADVYGPNFKVPTFDVTYKGSNYIQVLRCKARQFSVAMIKGERARKADLARKEKERQGKRESEVSEEFLKKKDKTIDTGNIQDKYTEEDIDDNELDIYNEFKGGLEKIAKKSDPEKRRDDLKWFWTNYAGEQNLCKWSSLRSQAEVYQDISAPVGTFFYMINPCVSKETSTTGKDECSYQVSLTEPIEFEENALAEDFRKKASELSDFEGEYDALLLRIDRLARKLLLEKESCLIRNKREYMAAEKARLGEAAQDGWLALGTTLGGSVAGAAIGVGVGKKATSAARGFAYGGAVFGAASAVYTFIKKLGRGKNKLSTNCAQAEKIAKEILDIRDGGQLDIIQQNIYDLSKELSALNEDFVGYDKAIDEMSGAKSFEK